jgi:peptidoglycan/xylan/chitin deacetylase (PgdA/CDA1 family)
MRSLNIQKQHKYKYLLKDNRFFLLLLLVIIQISLLTNNISSVYGVNVNGRRVCIFFDDGWENQYDIALPILKQFGFKATFSIITDLIGMDRGTFWSRMNVDEIRRLRDLGMEIASHTKTHPHMNNLTRDKLIDEIVNSRKILTEMGFDVKTFVYPYGEYNSTIIDYVKEAGYICARTTSYEPYYIDNLEARYVIGSYPITNQGFEEFTRILSQTDDRTIVVLTYHFISDVGPTETSTPTQNFYEQMKYLKDNNFEVLLLSDIISSKVDITPPNINIIKPSNGSTVSRTINIWVSATDESGINRVELYVDGNYLVTKYNSQIQFRLNTRNFMNGPHTIKVVAYDKKGNRGESKIMIYFSN